MMIVILPLGGTGERFRKNGYSRPKPMINVLGKPIIEWLLDNLSLKRVQMVIIPYNSELAKYRFEDAICRKYPDVAFKFLKLEIQTRGAAESVLMATNLIDVPDCPVLCMDGDNFYTCDIINDWKGDNAVFYVYDDTESQAYSFLDIDSDNVIKNIVEKKRISNMACTGAYGFCSWTQLKHACQKIIDIGLVQNGEFYMSGVVKYLVSENAVFFARPVRRDQYVCLGTPLDVRMFCARKNTMENRSPQIHRYCFDLDNTLVTYPRVAGDYSTVEPIMQNIEMVRYLKSLGHTIIIHTARRMKTHHGNIGKVVSDIGRVTIDTLQLYDIPYDELVFGKPYADYYIDDAAISAFADLEKETGFYKSKIEARSFHSIQSDVLHVYRKYGKDLSGEIYWYEHIPESVRDLFPAYYGNCTGYYTMERINGIPFSKLYLASEMNLEHIDAIINNIHRIHAVPIENQPIDGIDIYNNYVAKLDERYQNYDYSRFPDSDKVYATIRNALISYEKENAAKMSVIHGDPVLTNIMIDSEGKMKFIDMRGKQGSKTTLLGDAFYDWAKLYQSLIGYDEILEDRSIPISYKSTIVDYFKDRFIKHFGETQFEHLKYITASLLFTLIPLHDNAKCRDYYNLIFRLIQLKHVQVSKSIPMKFAICFSGSIRDFPTCFPSLRKYILNNLNADVFLHLWKMKDTTQMDTNVAFKWRNDACNEDYVISALQPIKYVIDEYSDTWENKIIQESRVDFSRFTDEKTKNYGTNACGMYYKIWKAQQLVDEYMQESGVKYDVIIRARLDFIWEEPILAEYFANASNSNVFLVRDRYATHSGLVTNDKFFAGSPSVMRRMCNIFNTIHDRQREGYMVEGQTLNQNHISINGFQVVWIGCTDTYYKCMPRHIITGVKQRIDIVHSDNSVFTCDFAYLLLSRNHQVKWQDYLPSMDNNLLPWYPTFNPTVDKPTISVSVRTKDNKELVIDVDFSTLTGDSNNPNLVTTVVCGVDLNTPDNYHAIYEFVYSIIVNNHSGKWYQFNNAKKIPENTIAKDETIVYKYLDHGYYICQMTTGPVATKQYLNFQGKVIVAPTGRYRVYDLSKYISVENPNTLPF